MKKIYAIFIIMFIFLSVSCKKDDNKDAGRLTGLVNFVNGTVKITGADTVTKEAEVGDEIKQGMRIETKGETSFVEIYFNENAIKVLGDSSVTMEQLLQNAEEGTRQVKFFIDKGKLFSRVSRKLAKNDIYEVKTPTTTAGVRGTEFIVAEETGKANVACLSGLVEVLNNSISDANAKPLNLNPMEEADVIPGQDMVKKQISDDRIKIMKIVADIKAMREDIRMKFEKQREEIRKHVEEQRSKDKAILEEQKTKDKALVDEQKQKDIQNIDNIKGVTKDAMEGTKVDKQDALKGIEDLKQSVKPKIEKLNIKREESNTDAKQE